MSKKHAEQILCVSVSSVCNKKVCRTIVSRVIKKPQRMPGLLIYSSGCKYNVLNVVEVQEGKVGAYRMAILRPKILMSSKPYLITFLPFTM